MQETSSLDFNATHFSYKYKYFQVPKSNMKIPIIKIERNDVKELVDLNKEIQQIIFRIEETLNLSEFIYPRVIVIDFLGLMLNGKEVIEKLKLNLDDDIDPFFIFPEGKEQKQCFDKVETALAEIAFKYKKRRQDGGKKMTHAQPINKPILKDFGLDISDLKINGYSEKYDGKTIGILKVSGRYGHGSEGDDDAKFLSWKLQEFDSFLKPDALIVDYTELDYTYGDAIRLLPYDYDLLPSKKPFRLVLSKKQLERLKFLLKNKKKNIVHSLKVALLEIQSNCAK